MTESMSNPTGDWKQKSRGMQGGGSQGGIYFMGFIGALVYFMQHSTSFKGRLLGFLKALVWPGVLVYKLAEFLKI